jgi:hypothetical protein
MANINTNLIDSFVSGARVRTLNYRGSVVSSVAQTAPINGIIAQNDLIYLCPIPYGSIIRSIKIGCSYAGTTNAVFTLTIFGLQKDGKTIANEIGFQGNPFANIFTTSNIPLMTEKATEAVVAQTVMWNLGTFDAQGVFTPKAEFAPYQDDRLGILALKCTTASVSITPGTITAIINYVELAPSDGPFLKTIGLTPQTL